MIFDGIARKMAFSKNINLGTVEKAKVCYNMSDIKWKMKDHRNCFDLRKDFNLIIMNRNKKYIKL